MVLTRSQYKNMSKEELLEQLFSHDDIAAKLSEFTKRFSEFSDKYETLHSELKITQNCNSFLLERVYKLERNAVSNSQYHRRETWEIHPVPLAIQDNVLEETVCQALSLTGIKVSPDEWHLCHGLNKKDRVMVLLSSSIRFFYFSSAHATIGGEQVITQIQVEYIQLCFSDRLCM